MFDTWKRRGSIVIVFALAALYAGVATASGGATTKACKKDLEKFCPDVTPGDGRVIKCLMKHMQELSKECIASAHAGHKRFHGPMKSFNRVCGDDVTRLCKDVKPGNGRLVRCLDGQRDKLGDECGSMVKGMMDRLGKVAEICADDINKFCDKGDAHITTCLGLRMKDLSPSCKAAFSHGAQDFR
ncbi:MAG: hypothetical protein GXP54_08200 [Deltaproteobacteria bacterium]|nr:hypothetical protein [Deltaproteobacteria bacterium]